LTPGIFSGLGVFETMRSYNGVIFALEDHLNRLHHGLKVLKIPQPCDRQKLRAYIYDALKTNRLKNARIRLTVWKGKKSVRMAIIVSPNKPYPKTKYAKGFKAMISNIRIDRKPRFCEVKSLDYFSFLMARRQAKVKGFDEALLLNPKGYISEGSYTNIFYVKDKVLFTPQLNSGCLNGITRQYVCAIAKRLKIEVKETLVLPGDLLQSDEAFVTNALIEIMPLTYLSAKPINKAKAGPFTKIFADEYVKLTKKLN